MKKLGAHHVVNSKDDAAMKKLAGQLDFILVTVNVSLNWQAYVNALAPRGRLHFVGAVEAPVALPVFPMLMAKQSMSASPLGSPVTTADMLEFCTRHGIAPVTETFPMTKVNDAIAHLRARQGTLPHRAGERPQGVMRVALAFGSRLTKYRKGVLDARSA